MSTLHCSVQSTLIHTNDPLAVPKYTWSPPSMMGGEEKDNPVAIARCTPSESATDPVVAVRPYSHPSAVPNTNDPSLAMTGVPAIALPPLNCHCSAPVTPFKAYNMLWAANTTNSVAVTAQLVVMVPSAV